MATSRCSCGEVIRWKADEAVSDEWRLLARGDLPGDVEVMEVADVLGRSKGAAFCPSCGRLWVAWENGNRLWEYVPVDPESRLRSRAPR